MKNWVTKQNVSKCAVAVGRWVEMAGYMICDCSRMHKNMPWQEGGGHWAERDGIRN